MTNTELREKLADIIRNTEVIETYGGGKELFTMTLNKKLHDAVVDNLIANGVTFAKDTDVPTKWISVTERLPTKEDAKIMDGYLPAIQKGGKPNIWKWAEVAKHPEWFTHWMPLPEPPKEE